MKTKTKATKLELKIEKLNTAYQKATPAQRRKMIAKDALAQINSGAIDPMRGVYVHLKGKVGWEAPLQPLLLNESKPLKCTCCAKGALFISCVRLSNRYHGDPSMIGSAGINDIVNWPTKNYNDIEAAFELWRGVGFDWTYRWSDKYPTSKLRLPAILKNIIRNKGTFKKNQV